MDSSHLSHQDFHLFYILNAHINLVCTINKNNNRLTLTIDNLTKQNHI